MFLKLKFSVFLMLIILLLWAAAGCSNSSNDGNNTGGRNLVINPDGSNIESSILKDAGDYYILGGDMLLDKNDENHQKIISKILNPQSQSSKGLTKTTTQLWPGGVVEFYFVNDFTAEEKRMIYYTMIIMEKICNVSFVEVPTPDLIADPSAGDYKYAIEKRELPEGVAGQSSFGYARRASLQISEDNIFSINKELYSSVLAHEIAHGIGMFHEHQRPDRDEYITIHWENIIETYRGQFEALPVGIGIILGDPLVYDYDSIMHYSSHALSVNGLETITSITEHPVTIFGNDTFSDNDKLSLVSLYGEPDLSKPYINVEMEVNTIEHPVQFEVAARPVEFGYPEPQQKVFTIKNNGGGTLELTGDPIVQISGDLEFTVIEQPGVTSLAAGETTTFTVEFSSNTESITYNALISIQNNSSINSEYEFRLEGKGKSYPVFMNFSNILGLPLTEGITLSGDIDGDGKDDLVRLIGSGFVLTCFSNGDGTYRYKMKNFSEETGIFYEGQWLTADINGDSKSDLVHLHGENSITIWESNGDGSYTYNLSELGGPSNSNGITLAGDINGDGKTDLVRLFGIGFAFTYFSNGDGTFINNFYNLPQEGYSFAEGKWLPGDVNGDGKIDLIHLPGDNSIISWISNGNGAFNYNYYENIFGLPELLNAGIWAAGDTNGDGSDDLIFIINTGTSCPYITSWSYDDTNGGYNYESLEYPVESWCEDGQYPLFNGYWLSADINSDNKSDMLHINEGNAVPSFIINPLYGD